MPSLAVVVFASVFAIVLLLSMSFDSSRVEARKKTGQRLDSISLAADRSPEDEGIGLIREELLSSIPWMNRWLQRQDVFARFRKYLKQADLQWTITRLVAMSVAAWVVAGAALFFRTNDATLSTLIGAGAAAGP